MLSTAWKLVPSHVTTHCSGAMCGLMDAGVASFIAPLHSYYLLRHLSPVGGRAYYWYWLGVGCEAGNICSMLTLLHTDTIKL